MKIPLSSKQLTLIKQYAFLLRLILFYFLWKGTYFFIWRVDVLFETYNKTVWWLIARIIDLSALSLDFIGFKDLIIAYPERLIAIKGSGGVDIGEPCIGLGVFYMFISLTVAWKGLKRKQLWFIPVGLLILHLLNIARVSTLCLLSHYNRALLDFNHDFTFKIIIYSAIFGLWMYWIKLIDRSANNLSVVK